jgi:hypothetical protein
MYNLWQLQFMSKMWGQGWTPFPRFPEIKTKQDSDFLCYTYAGKEKWGKNIRNHSLGIHDTRTIIKLITSMMSISNFRDCQGKFCLWTQGFWILALTASSVTLILNIVQVLLLVTGHFSPYYFPKGPWYNFICIFLCKYKPECDNEMSKVEKNILAGFDSNRGPFEYLSKTIQGWKIALVLL